MHYHLIGICGTAMASLAGMLQARGHKVTGSDQNVYPPMSTQLAELGIEIMQGYKAENADVPRDVTVVGNTIMRGNPEAGRSAQPQDALALRRRLSAMCLYGQERGLLIPTPPLLTCGLLQRSRW